MFSLFIGTDNENHSIYQGTFLLADLQGTKFFICTKIQSPRISNKQHILYIIVSLCLLYLIKAMSFFEISNFRFGGEMNNVYAEN